LTMARRSLAHNFQAVWYGAAIMALCWPATPSEVKFAADSLLEGRVTSELVSEFPNSLLTGKEQGIFTFRPCERANGCQIREQIQ
jgi:hypothetical protein